MPLPEDVQRYFVKANLEMEGLSALDYARWRGTTGYNNGILAVVDPEGEVWVTSLLVFAKTSSLHPTPMEAALPFAQKYRGGGFLDEILETAGYEAKDMCGMWVPHSNGTQEWVRDQLARQGVSREALIREILNEQERAEVTARLDRIQAIAQNQ